MGSLKPEGDLLVISMDHDPKSMQAHLGRALDEQMVIVKCIRAELR